jgi:hypothetical protein
MQLENIINNNTANSTQSKNHLFVMLANEILRCSGRLHDHVSGFQSYTKKLHSACLDYVDCLIRKTDNRVHVVEICSLIRVCFEACLDRMMSHSDPSFDTKPRLNMTEKVLYIKPFFQPTQINCFFELKELVSTAMHTGSCSERDLRISLQGLHEVIEYCVLFLSKPAPNRSATSSAPRPRDVFIKDQVPHSNHDRQNGHKSVPFLKYEDAKKTQICRHFLEGNCSYGSDCNFAHGEEELKKV